MAKHFLLICLFLLAVSLYHAISARILDEDTPQMPFPAATSPAAIPDPTADIDDPIIVAPVLPPDATVIPAAPLVATLPPPSLPLPVGSGSVATPSTTVPPATAAGIGIGTGAVASPATAAGVDIGTGAVAGAATGIPSDHPILAFFMHDILGGSHPSGRVVTGVITSTDANGLPFSKANNQIFPINGGVPLNTLNGVINNNNIPSLVGLNGNGNTIVSNSNGGNNVNAANNQPFVTAGQLPAGLTLQQLMFGSVTVVDNEITEGRELDTAVLGSAQGFYLASSLDGTSHTLALTAMFHGGEHGGEHGSVDDSISFFGIHRTATPISHLAVIGGTGKYEGAKGHATIETDLHHEDQHTTDGVETITQFSVYLTPA